MSFSPVSDAQRLEAFHQEQESRLRAGKRGGALLQTHESGKAGMEHFHGFRLRAIDGCQGREPFHQPFPQHSRFRHPVPPFQNGLDGRKGAGISLFQPGKQVFFRFRKEFLLDFVQRGAATLLAFYSQGGAEQGGARQGIDGARRPLFFQCPPKVAEQIHDTASGKRLPFRIVEAPAVLAKGCVQGDVHVRIANAQGDVRRFSFRCAGDDAARFFSQPCRIGRNFDLVVADFDGAPGPLFRQRASPGIKGGGFFFRRMYPYLDGYAISFRMLEGMAQGRRHLRCAGQNNVSTCFPQGIQQPGRGFRLHGGPVFKLPAFQLLRALSLQPFHVLPAFVSARTGMVGHDAGDALVRHGVPQVLQAAGHFQHAGKILRHGAWKQAGIKAVRRFPQGQEPPGQFFRSGRRFFLFFHPGKLVCRNDLGSEDCLCTGNGGEEFPQLPPGFPCGNQHQMPVEVISQGQQAFRYSTAGRFVPG